MVKSAIGWYATVRKVKGKERKKEAVKTKEYLVMVYAFNIQSKIK